MLLDEEREWLVAPATQTNDDLVASTAEPRPLTAGPIDPSAGRARLAPVPPGAARITGGWWAQRQRANRERAIPAGLERLESAGNLENLRIAAGASSGSATGPVFMDSDVYKWLEAAAWEYGRAPSEQLLTAIRDVTGVVAAAQAEDGYLDSVVQVTSGRQGRYQDLPWSHELYCAGHLFQAAVAVVRATGEQALLQVARRLADHLVETFGEGPDQLRDVDGHPVVEMGLAELFRQTGEPRYLELARWFVEARGHGIIEGHGHEPTYFSDRVPVRQARSVEGHAVRAVYLAAGAADVATELADQELLTALGEQFADMLATKTYLTGGLGSRWDREAFGDPYELPSDRAYAETCAAIGGVQWAWRMLLATGDPLYADTAERMLYNGFPAGVSLGGDEYFYVNPLQMRQGAHPDENRSPAHGRRGWFDCACCPPNIMRTWSSLDGYLATTDADGIQLHLYSDSEITASLPGGTVRLAVRTDYPWEGMVRVRAEQVPEGEWTLSLRVPAWAHGAVLRVGGQQQEAPAGGYVSVTRAWQAGEELELELPMAVRAVRADRRVDDVRGAVAFERGPLVFAVEQVDQDPALVVDDLVIDLSAGVRAEFREDLLGGVTVLHAHGHRGGHRPGVWPYTGAEVGEPGANGSDGADRPEPGSAGDSAAGEGAVEVLAVPYATWANRGPNPMRVWLPTS